ncbi:MAG TPA: hypothetical protein DCP92_14540 [Nitrospiraceae bacterium]|jgi:predicted CopG family antitoxin|nr:hypothetical protein [Nitrospiraceae bacterium]
MTKKKQGKNPFLEGEKFEDLTPLAREHLGFPGRMLYHSKSLAKPTTIFNANLFNKEARKIWYGDLEIERDREALLKLSEELGPLYILWEMDGRFLESEPTPGYVKAKAAVTVADGEITYSEHFKKYIEAMKERLARIAKKRKDRGVVSIIAEGKEAETGMRYDIHHKSGKVARGHHYMAITPDIVGGFAFGKTAKSALRALKRIYTLSKKARKTAKRNPKGFGQ